MIQACMNVDARTVTGAPRVSGDDPNMSTQLATTDPCSPRERG